MLTTPSSSVNSHPPHQQGKCGSQNTRALKKVSKIRMAAFFLPRRGLPVVPDKSEAGPHPGRPRVLYWPSACPCRRARGGCFGVRTKPLLMGGRRKPSSFSAVIDR